MSTLNTGGGQATAPLPCEVPTQVELANMAYDLKQTGKGKAPDKPTSFPPILDGYRYRPQAKELRAIAAEQTLAAWRHKGKGPPYSLCGSNITYEGSDLLAWLKAQRINPTIQAA